MIQFLIIGIRHYLSLTEPDIGRYRYYTSDCSYFPLFSTKFTQLFICLCKSNRFISSRKTCIRKIWSLNHLFWLVPGFLEEKLKLFWLLTLKEHTEKTLRENSFISITPFLVPEKQNGQPVSRFFKAFWKIPNTIGLLKKLGFTKTQNEVLLGLSNGFSVKLRARSFGIFRNKNIFRNIFRLFCSWK